MHSILVRSAGQTTQASERGRAHSAEGVRRSVCVRTDFPRIARVGDQFHAEPGRGANRAEAAQRVPGHSDQQLLCVAVGAAGELPLCAAQRAGAADPGRRCDVEHLRVVEDQQADMRCTNTHTHTH